MRWGATFSTVNELCMNHLRPVPTIPKSYRSNHLIFVDLLGTVGGVEARHCPHNPKVVGSNPTPAIKRIKG